MGIGMKQEKYPGYQDILNHLKKEEILPVYLFWGKENYLKETILNKFKEKLLNPSTKELNYKTFSADRITSGEIINELEILPFLSKNKLIILKEAEKLNQEEVIKLASYLNKSNLLNTFSTLIIIYQEGSPHKDLLEAVKGIGKIVKFDFPDKSRLNFWINNKLSKSNKRIDREALDYLHYLIGSELRSLFSEIEKLDLYTQGKKLIEKEDILAIYSGSETVNIFKFLDNLGDKKLKDSVDGIVKLNNSNLFSLSVLAMIYRQIRLILQTKFLLLNKSNFSQIKKELNLPDFVIEKLMVQAKKFNLQEICHIYKLLNEADLELKDSQKSPQIILEELVMKIINQR